MSDVGFVWHWVRIGVMPYGWSTIRVWHERVGEKVVHDSASDNDYPIAEWGPRIYEPGESASVVSKPDSPPEVMSIETLLRLIAMEDGELVAASEGCTPIPGSHELKRGGIKPFPESVRLAARADLRREGRALVLRGFLSAEVRRRLDWKSA